MEIAPRPVARLRIVRALAALAWLTWVGAALSPWYTSTRVDSDPDTTIGLGLGLVPHLLAIAPFVLAVAAARGRVPLPWWAPVTAFLLALPGLAVGMAVPAFAEAATTDTEVVGEQGVWVLLAAVVLAVAAVAAGSLPRPFRTPEAGWSG